MFEFFTGMDSKSHVPSGSLGYIFRASAYSNLYFSWNNHTSSTPNALPSYSQGRNFGLKSRGPSLRHLGAQDQNAKGVESDEEWEGTPLPAD